MNSAFCESRSIRYRTVRSIQNPYIGKTYNAIPLLPLHDVSCKIRTYKILSENLTRERVRDVWYEMDARTSSFMRNIESKLFVQDVVRNRGNVHSSHQSSGLAICSFLCYCQTMSITCSVSHRCRHRRPKNGLFQNPFNTAIASVACIFHVQKLQPF